MYVCIYNRFFNCLPTLYIKTYSHIRLYTFVCMCIHNSINTLAFETCFCTNSLRDVGNSSTATTVCRGKTDGHVFWLHGKTRKIWTTFPAATRNNGYTLAACIGVCCTPKHIHMPECCHRLTYSKWNSGNIMKISTCTARIYLQHTHIYAYMLKYTGVMELVEN